MAAVLSAAQPIHQSAHFLGAHHFNRDQARHAGQRKQQYQSHHQHNGFEAFASHHHSRARGSPAATSASWRTHAPATPSLAMPPRRPSSIQTRATQSRPSRPALAIVTSTAARAPKPTPKAKVHGNASSVYSMSDLLCLSRSPLVAVSAEKRAVLDDFVEHYVWRRGPSPLRTNPPSGFKRGHVRRNSSSSNSSSGRSSVTQVHSDSE